MSVLQEHQFEILPTEDAADGFVFGIHSEVSVDGEGGFVPGSADWITQDGVNSQRGTTAFGRDRLTGPSWSWQAHVNRDDVPGALESLGRIATAWRPTQLVKEPGAVTAIRYRVGDRVRRIYGRPRRFEAPPNNQILNGFVPVSMDFKCVDAYTYDDVGQSVVLGAPGASLGGFIFPVIFPTTTLPVGLQSDQAVVGGDAITHPVVRFNGPVLNPRLIANDWTLALDYQIPAGSYVEIDTRPWKLTVLLNGTTSVAGKLAPRQRFSDIAFTPGRHDLAFRGSSSSGSPTCEVRWNSAHNSI